VRDIIEFRYFNNSLTFLSFFLQHVSQLIQCKNKHLLAFQALFKLDLLQTFLWHNKLMKVDLSKFFKFKWYLVFIILATLVLVLWSILYFFSDEWNGQNNLEYNAGALQISNRIYPDEYGFYSSKLSLALDEIDDAGLEWSSESLVVVDISEQREYIFTDTGVLYGTYTISTGRSAVSLGTTDDGVEKTENRGWVPGVWRIYRKLDENVPAGYGPRIMFLERYSYNSWIRTSVALHGTNRPDLLGVPWSLGCVYHENAVIIELYEVLEVNDLVVAID
ncbi:L,D-transpeptidase, partial [Candidatus Dojkabacteria bacterium]|nr:L,D-transpeptidase [Candidatus Dojkabacteria bacterium]